MGLDPACIARLRDPARYDLVDPNRIWTVVPKPVTSAPDQCVVVDVGAGVGFVTFSLAFELTSASIIACDILSGMLDLLAEDAEQREVANIECRVMPGPTELPLADGEAALMVMLQVHHELDEPQALLRECHRILRPDGYVVIVDWKDEDLNRCAAGRTPSAVTGEPRATP